MKRYTQLLTGLFALLLFASCAPKADQHADNEAPETNFTNAVAVVHPTEGNEVNGTVTFTTGTDGITVKASISGLTEGQHGFHIHQYGDCTASNGTSAGGHYNPDNTPHGEPGPDSHDGDLGNITADADGNATLDITSSDIVMNGAKSIIGRGIVIHSGQDDFTSQPSGAAGSRVACGVIGVANSGS